MHKTTLLLRSFSRVCASRYFYKASECDKTEEFRLKEIRGAVFPLPHDAIERLLTGEKDVFVKFGRFLYLSSGQKLLFYDSSVHAIVGEAEIFEVLCISPADVWSKYGQRLFLSRDEFDKYVSTTPLGPRNTERAPDKIVTVCILRKPKRYSSPRKLGKRMNMIGHYLRE